MLRYTYIACLVENELFLKTAVKQKQHVLLIFQRADHHVCFQYFEKSQWM